MTHTPQPSVATQITPAQRRRRRTSGVAGVVAAASMLATLAAGAAPVGASGDIEGLEALAYTEGDGAVQIAPNAVINKSGSFADGFIEFSIANSTATETLALPQSATPSTDPGVVSTVGSKIYLGLGGTDYKQIAVVDATKDGRQGRALRVNFTAPLDNADFEGTVTGAASAQNPAGWTINRSTIALDSSWTRSNGAPLTVTDNGDGTYTVSKAGGYSFITNFDYSTDAAWKFESTRMPLTTAGEYKSDVVNYDGRINALRLSQKATCTAKPSQGYCSMFGPDATSQQFSAKAGDQLAVDWAAKQTDDHFEVYGLLEEVNASGTVIDTEVLIYGRAETLAWSRATGTIPRDGNYRFRFIAGSYDKTGGKVMGAEFYIDNIRVLPQDANAALATTILQSVTYENTSDTPPTQRTVTVTTGQPDQAPSSSQIVADVTPVDDAPRWGTAATVTYTNNATAGQTFMHASGTFAVTDPEADPIVMNIAGSTEASITLSSTGYDRALSTAKGTLYWSTSHLKWHFVPDDAAIDTTFVPWEQEVMVQAVSNGLTTEATMTLRVAVADEAPGAPTITSATGGNTKVALAVTPNAFTGLSSTSHTVRYRRVGDASWSTTTATTGNDPYTAEVTGLTNGVAYEFEVVTSNTAGTSGASNRVTATPYTTPATPTISATTPGNTQVELTWSAPNNGGSAITGYRVEYSLDGGMTWNLFTTTNGLTTSATVTGLYNGSSTMFQVIAINAAGDSAPASSTATPRTVAGAPTISSVTPDDGVLIVAFEAPASDGGAEITGYEYRVDGGAWVAVPNPALGAVTIGGLTNGTAVAVELRAVNAAGGSSAASTSGTPRTVASAPTLTTITENNTSIGLAWTAPVSNGGAAISGYEIWMSDDGGLTWTLSKTTDATTTTTTIADLTNGTDYTFRVVAKNVAGSSAASTSLSGIPHTTPTAPTVSSVTPDNGSLTVAFTAPSSTGGAAITGYEYRVDGGAWITVTNPETGQFVVSGLTNGTAANIELRAVNRAGGSTAASGTGTPRTVATAPVLATVTERNQELQLDWAAPTNTGGAAITGYQIEVSTDYGLSWTTVVANTNSTATSYTFDGLANGAGMTYRISAINAAGVGVASNELTGIPHTVASAPQITTVVESDSTVRVSFAAPTSTGGAPITGYVYRINGGDWIAVDDPASMSFELTGLTNGTPIKIEVAAVNRAGIGAAASPTTATPKTTPTRPQVASIVAGNASATVTFAAPTDDGGAAIQKYQYSLDGGVTWVDVQGPLPSAGTSGSFTIYGLKNGAPINVVMRAINSEGASIESAASTATPRPEPIKAPGASSGGAGGASTGGAVSAPGPVATRNGEPTPVVVVDLSKRSEAPAPAGTIGVTSGEVELKLSSVDGKGKPMASDDTTLPIIKGGTTSIGGSGFQPGSSVDVWSLNGERLLGTALVGPDGSFTLDVTFDDDLVEGPASIQINGIGADGALRSITLDAVVLGRQVERPETLAFTGSSTTNVAGLGIALIALGSLARRRQEAGE